MIDAASTIDWAGRAAEARRPRQMIIGRELRSCAERGDFGLNSPRDGREIIRVPVHALEKYTELKTTWIQL